MSLVQRITTRRLDDIINQGYRFALTGSVGTVTDTAIQTGAIERTIVTTGFVLSTTSATDVLVSLGYKAGVSATVTFFQGYVRAGGPIIFVYSLGDERYSIPGDALVITTNAAGPVVYTINGRIVGEKVALGYIEHAGAPAHSGSPGFPPEYSGFSGLWRGGFPA
jgi:hypothetical protein